MELGNRGDYYDADHRELTNSVCEVQEKTMYLGDENPLSKMKRSSKCKRKIFYSASEIQEETMYFGDEGPHLKMKRSSKCRRKVYLMTLTFFSALGSLLFGYGTGIVSGAMIKVNEVFNLSRFWHGLIVSVAVGAAGVASLIGGPFSELLGRKIVLISSAVVFTAGSILLSASGAKEVLLVGRIVVGLAIGECV